MTYQSVLTAAISQIRTQLPAVFTTLEDADDREYEPLRPDDMPACIFTQSMGVTRHIAMGLRREEWLLEAHIWQLYTPIAGSAADFRGMVQGVRVALLKARDFQGAANVGTPGTTGATQVLTTAEADQGAPGVQTTFSKPIRRGATAERHALVAVRVRDLISD